MLANEQQGHLHIHLRRILETEITIRDRLKRTIGDTPYALRARKKTKGAVLSWWGYGYSQTRPRGVLQPIACQPSYANVSRCGH